MVGERRHIILNCFDDLDLCIIIYFVSRVLFYVLYDFSLMSCMPLTSISLLILYHVSYSMSNMTFLSCLAETGHVG